MILLSLHYTDANMVFNNRDGLFIDLIWRQQSI